jgi:hypothetical protein
MVFNTVLVDVSITETLLLFELVTYARVPVGFTTTPRGRLPTATVVSTVLLAVSITDRSLLK